MAKTTHGADEPRPAGELRALAIPALRPHAGRRLPRALRAERVGTLAGALQGGIADPGFEQLLARIDDSVFRPAAGVEVYFEGEKAFGAMLADVAAASAEVLLESYILKDDETGRRFQAALIAASGRGVRVRVLADALGSFSTRSAFWSELRRAGIDARLYHPLGVPLRFLKFRDHRKILVVDRRVAYTGGMNIGNEYGSSLRPVEGQFRDTHARVEGQTAWEMAIVFREGWQRAGGAAIALEPLEPATAPGPRVMVLDSRPGRGARETAAAFSAIVGAARRRLWITAAYFAPRPRVVRILGAAARRGVDVRLLVPGRSDVRLVRHAGHGFFSGLLSRRHTHLRIPARDPPRQDLRRRRPGERDRLEQPRLPVLRAQCRVQLRDPGRHGRGGDGASVRERPRRIGRDPASRMAPPRLAALDGRCRRPEARAAALRAA